jgi:hypothetical protein
MYFLLLTFLELFPKINPTPSTIPGMLPALVFVVGVSMIKDAYEDYGRAK